MKHGTLIPAGGRFWGMQDLIRKRDRVISTRVGYSAEMFRMRRIPTTVPMQKPSRSSSIRNASAFRQPLEFLFQVHDPSDANRQGNEVDTSSRSAIFTTSDGRGRVAGDTIADVDASGLSPGPMVTEVTRRVPSGKRSQEHEDAWERIPNGYTCHFVRPGWRLPLRNEAGGAAGCRYKSEIRRPLTSTRSVPER